STQNNIYCNTHITKTHTLSLLDALPIFITELKNPNRPDGNLIILKGNLAPSGAVTKVSGVKVDRHTGPARVYNTEEEATHAVINDEINEGDVLVIRYVGPKGGPGMPEMLSISSILVGKGLGEKVALLTDGRFS